MAKQALKILNGIYGWIIGAVIAITALYAAYAIWDNAQIYKAAENVQTQVRELKPIEDAEGGPSFEELLDINKDVIAWLTVDGTNIDYPVLQGENNITYMDKDVYGQFSMAGSIFLDSRNNPNFKDNYSLVYGHNMADHLMFGDLALFKDKTFFEENTTATIMLPGNSKDMSVAAVLQLSAGTDEIFDPDMWTESLGGLGAFLEENSIWYHSSWIEILKKYPETVRVVVLVTCSSGSTNDRTIVVLIEEKPEEEITPPKEDDPTPNKPDQPQDNNSNHNTPTEPNKDGDVTGSGPQATGETNDMLKWYLIIAASIIIMIGYEALERRARYLQ